MLVRTFGEVIRERRHRLNLTQQQVAGRIGVSTPFVGHLELCKRRPSHHTVQLLADVLGLDQSELFLTANPEAAELLRWRRAASSPWEQFRQTYQAEVEPLEIDLLAKVASMGQVGSPRDFLYILNSVRQVLGRDLIDFAARRIDTSPANVESSSLGSRLPSR
jgi:transcriptional regulator with XRE-family HTH domain